VSMRRKQKTVLRIGAGKGDAVSQEPHDPSSASQPGFSLEQAEEERRVQNALNRLSPEHRAVLILKDLEGQKYEIMAEILGIPIGTVRSRLHRARLELRNLLEQDGE